MTNTTEQSEIIYTPSDVADILKVQESTIRKYCNMLEESGLKFHKNEYGHRGFFEKDIIIFKRLIKLKKRPDMNLKQACDVVATTIQEHFETDDISDITDKFYITKDEFQAFKEQQEEFQKQLLEQLKKQHEYIDNSLKQRDQALITAMRETMETQKLIASSQEKKKAWWKFWK